VGVTHYRPAAAVSLCSDRHHRTLRAKPELQALEDQVAAGNICRRS